MLFDFPGDYSLYAASADSPQKGRKISKLTKSIPDIRSAHPPTQFYSTFCVGGYAE